MKAHSGKKGGKGGSRWMQRHVGDPHVRQAQVDGYRSRAVYKLREIDERDSLIRPGSAVLELGSAPGGWTQYAVEKAGEGAMVIASDILPMEAVAGARFVQGDFTEAAVAEELERAFGARGCDLVISDMAPNLSGVPSSDQARAMALAELAHHTALRVLGPDGAFVVKVFQGEGFDAFVKALRATFASVKVRKPDASRSRSREVYLVATKLI